MKGHAAGVRCVIVLNTTEIMSCSDDGTVRRWNTSDGTCSQTCGTQTTAILSVASFPDSTDFVGCVADHTLQVWHEQTLKQTVALPDQSLSAVCVLSNGDMVANTRLVTVTVYVISHFTNNQNGSLSVPAYLELARGIKRVKGPRT